MATVRYDRVPLYGGLFIVNANAANPQYEPSVAALDSGGFVVGWTHELGTTGGTTNKTVASRVFSPTRAPLTGSDQVVSQVGFNFVPEVVTFADGRSLMHFTNTWGITG